MKKSVLVTFLYLSLPLALLCTSASDIRAGSKAKGPRLPAASIHQLVKNVAWNEFQASEHPTHFYRYLERDISADGSTTTDIVATSHGEVARLIEVNNHPPDAQQLRKSQQLLEKLPGDPKLQQSRLQDQQSNRQRRDNIIKDIPDAFIYSYDGRNPMGLIKLKFRPAPDFKPSSRQSLILQGMAGELWVDPATQRMVKIDGKLIQDVKIGWGFLARLQTGGTFLMQQSKGPDGTWYQKLLSVHFDGTEFIFKHIHIRVKQLRCCFQRLPDHLTIHAAVHLLKADKQLPADWQSRLQPAPKSSELRPHSSDHALRR